MSARQMHAGQIDTDVQLVTRLLAGQFPQWADLPIQPFDSSGTVNALYRLGADMVLRLPILQAFATDPEPEQEWLQWLAPKLDVATPELLAIGRPAENYPCSWTVFRWLEGTVPVPGKLEEPQLLAADIAEFIRSLRRIDPTGGPAAKHFGPLAAEDPTARTSIAQLRGIIDTGAATAAWEASLKAPEWSGSPALIHGDLIPGNLLLRGGRLSAVIDWTASIGDPARDLLAAWYVLSEPERSAFRDLLQVDDAAWARSRGWAMIKALAALPYYRESNPVMAGNARRVIEEVLQDERRAGA